jgi:conjugal transfer pilus assembly protein TraW
MKVVLLVLLLPFFNAIGDDLGTHGVTFPIIEPDMILEIKLKLENLKTSGQIDKMNEQFKNKAMDYVNRPTPLKNIKHTIVAREWLFDPAVLVKDDLKDQSGKIFHKAGSRVNPLDYINLTNVLIFIDGDSKEHINYAREQNIKYQGHTKIILVNGHITNLMKRFKTRFYFDQEGTLTRKFGITSVPAIVSQEAKALKIKEVLL